ncbi:MAG: nitroreductase family protein [Anaerolineae bacterium]|jgi:NAD-dependent dihydropyrimidine dehydrogenase PreA subunit/nitroreductase
MVVVDKETCRGCGLCAKICHERCITLDKGNGSHVVEIDHMLCSTCSQCIAICPQQALSWDEVPPVAYEPGRLPSAAQLEELLKQRRTIRRFQERKMERALVEEIVGYSIYAPTNNYDLRAIVVDDRQILETLDAIIMRYVSWVYRLLYRPTLVFNLVRAVTPAIGPKTKVKMEHSLKTGRAFDSPPGALVFVVGDRRILLSEASAQYALYNMILYAQARGIGSRINGGIPLTLDRSKRARRCLGLQKQEQILAALELGYPAVRFRNKVEGKTMRVAWNGREPNG